MSDSIINTFYSLSYFIITISPSASFIASIFKMIWWASDFLTAKYSITEDLRILSSLFIGTYCYIFLLSFCFLPCVANIPNSVQYRFLILSSPEYYLVSPCSSSGQYLLILFFPLGASIILHGGPSVPCYLCFPELNLLTYNLPTLINNP